jgi:glycosyltransferase A (GT-A) superfamily protein (DUF2064 family)
VTRRVVAVLVARPAPDGLDPPDLGLRMAMLEDVYETVAVLELVEAAVVVAADDPLAARVGEVTWPGTAVHAVPAGEGALGGRALRVLAAGLGEGQLTLVAADAPDLPGLLVGKLHRALGSAEVAVLPAAGGGLVAIATRVPLPGWLPDADLDRPDALEVLRAAASRRTAVAVGPGWHRVRARGDVAHLDPGLEGWDVTRALLAR